MALGLYHGNIDLFIAAAVALGFRYPWTWGFVLLTKVTPGVGLLWFAVRREWRALAIALGVTGAIVAVSLAVNPQLWNEWFTFLGEAEQGRTVEQFQIGLPLWARLAAAAALVVWGARTEPSLDRRRGGDDRAAHPVAERLRDLRRPRPLGDAPGRRVRQIDFAGCRTKPAWRSSCRPSTRRPGWDPPSTSCSGTSRDAARRPGTAPPARPACPRGSRSSSWTMEVRTGPRALVLARPEANGGGPAGTTLRLLTVPHGGKGAAVRAGMLAADADLIVFTDADMATPPDQLPLLIDALADHDVALGSRIQPDGSDMRTSQPVYRRALGRLFHGLASIWVVGSVQDTQCGFKGFTRAAAHDLFEAQQIRSIVFDIELIYLARRRGYSIAIVPIRWSDRRGSRMRPRLGLALTVAWDLLRIPLLHRGVRRVGT